MTGHATGEQTLSQRRAAFALQRVRDIKDQSFAKEFRSHASGLPAMIQMNGFGQALAFLRSKPDNEAYQALYQTVSDWLRQEKQPYENQDALAGIVEKSMSTYRLAQNETMALLDWVKRFATAFIELPKKVPSSTDSNPAER